MARIQDSKSMLLIPNPKLNFVDFLCINAVVEAARQNGETHVISPKGKLEKYAQIESMPQNDKIKMIQKIAPRKFILSFNKSEGDVKNIQWQQNDKEVNFYISMNQGIFKPEGMNFRTEGSNYDTVIYMNVADFESIKYIFEPYQNLTKEAQNIVVGSKLSIPESKADYVNDPKEGALVERVAKLIGTNNKSANTKLLAALLIETKRFKGKLENPARVMKLAAALVEGGADYQAANSIIDKYGQARKQQKSSQGNQKQTKSSNNQDQKQSK